MANEGRRDAGCGIQDAGYGTQDAGCWIHDAGAGYKLEVQQRNGRFHCGSNAAARGTAACAKLFLNGCTQIWYTSDEEDR